MALDRVTVLKILKVSGAIDPKARIRDEKKDPLVTILEKKTDRAKAVSALLPSPASSDLLTSLPLTSEAGAATAANAMERRNAPSIPFT